MEQKTWQMCFDEISHLILDLDKKVTVLQVSGNWSISVKDSEKILTKWLDKQTNQSDFSKEFLIRGIHKDGHCVISVISELKFNQIKSNFVKISNCLYSIETATSSNRLNITERVQSNVISLPLNSEERKIKEFRPKIEVNTTKAVPVKPDKLKAFFGTSSSKDSKAIECKIEKSPVSEKETIKNETTTSNSLKESPKKKEPNTKPSGEASSVRSSSISSFFAKPGTKSTITEKSKTIESSEKIEENQLPISAAVLSTDKIQDPIDVDNRLNSNKRSLSAICDTDSDSDVIQDTPKVMAEKKSRQTKKKIKKSVTEKKHSDIAQINDSDEDNIVKNVDLLPEKQKENTTLAKEGNNTVAVTPKRRAKAKRCVVRTYEDEDGYIITKREMEEYSCSEEETVDNNEKMMTNTANTIEKTSPVLPSKPKSTKKIAAQVNTRTKQGSILSFFGKK